MCSSDLRWGVGSIYSFKNFHKSGFDAQSDVSYGGFRLSGNRSFWAKLNSIINAYHILLFDEGKILARGSHTELMAQCKEYKNLWKFSEQTRGWKVRENREVQL